MKNLYDVLGVQKGASDAEIKQAYRALAKKLHPDVNRGDAKISERFKEVSAAHAILGDKEKRTKYDRGEIDAAGNDVHRGFSGTGRGQGGFDPSHFGGMRAEDLFKDIFGGMAGGAGPRDTRSFKTRGQDRSYKLTIRFLDAVRGETRRITLANGKTLDVKIAAGVEDGQQIRLKGQGEPGSGGGPNGDAIVEINIQPHKSFVRDGIDIHLDTPITLKEAVLGAKIAVPTIHGTVTVTIPAGSNTGQILRLKGKGINVGHDKKGAGDQLLRLEVMLPEVVDADLEKFIRKWSDQHEYDVRSNLDAN